jgi:hypothetical protein
MNYKAALDDYYTTTVKPTVSEFLKNTQDIRRARLAAIVLDHMRDYVALVKGKSSKPESVLRDMKDDCPDALIIRDVCNASKHGYLIGNERGDLKRVATNSNQVTAEDNPGLFEAPFGEGSFSEANEVYLKYDKPVSKGNKGRNLSMAVENVLNYWEKTITKF